LTADPPPEKIEGMPDLTECPLARINAPDPEIEKALRAAKTIAIVGLSPNPERPSHAVAVYLRSAGYRIIPVNPAQPEILGEKCWPDLDSVPGPVDLVDIFLRPDRIPPVVDAAIRKGAKCVWMQLGIVHNDAARAARDAGLTVVMNRCTKIEHARLIAGTR